jgi:hypothetical protein
MSRLLQCLQRSGTLLRRLSRFTTVIDTPVGQNRHQNRRALIDAAAVIVMNANAIGKANSFPPIYAIISPTYGKLRLLPTNSTRAPNGGTQGMTRGSSGARRIVRDLNGPRRPTNSQSSSSDAVPSKKGSKAGVRMISAMMYLSLCKLLLSFSGRD